MKKIEVISYGADPEFAVVNENNEVVIVNQELPGSKMSPYIVNEEFEIGVQPDGVAIEMTCAPAFSKKEYMNRMLLMKHEANVILKKLNPNLKIQARSSATYNIEELRKNPKCMEFGCSTSYCAWTEMPSKVPPVEKVGSNRSFGGHFHLGISNLTTNDDWADTIMLLVKCIDLHAGVPSILIDLDTKRREIYGNPGDFRYKFIDTGVVVEYRVLGGNFLATSETIEWCFDAIMKGVDYYNSICENENEISKLLSCGQEIQDCISNGDRDLAYNICDVFNIEIPTFTVENEIVLQNQNQVCV